MHGETHLPATAPMAEDDWSAVGRGPTIPPLCQGHYHWLEIESPLGRSIDCAVIVLAFEASLKNTVFDETLKAVRQNVRSYAEAALEFREPRHTTEQYIAQDQNAPPLPDHFECAGSRAILAIVGSTEHRYS